MTSPNSYQSRDSLDKLIESTLNAINAAAPPENMKARVLQRARLKSVPGPWFLRAAPWSFASAACSVALALGIAALVQHNRAIESEEASHLFVPRFISHPTSTPASPHGAQKADPHNIPNAGSTQNLVLVATRDSHGPSGTTASPGIAYSEMLAPSKPAPELPLTDQEKRLLKAARRQDEQNQVAELRHPLWPLHDPEDDDDFEQFFNRSTTNAMESPQ